MEEIAAIDRKLARQYKSAERARYDEIMAKYVPAVREQYPAAKRIEPIIKWWNHGEFDLGLMPANEKEGIAVDLGDKQIFIKINND